MGFRSAQIYIQGQTRYRLTLLARVVPPISRGNGAEATSMSADELGDSLLNEAMFSKYPVLGQLEAQIKVLEKAASEAIKKGSQ